MQTEPLSLDAIVRSLHDIQFVRRVEYRSFLGSTNDLARQLAAEGAPEATLVFADEQTAGRGRLGRAWWSPPGTAIALSLLLRPVLAPVHAYRLTMLAGVATAEALEQVTGLPIKCKWPNDIVLEKTPVAGRQPPVFKLGGILTETSLSSQAFDFAIVGIGLNVNVDLGDRTDLPEATSLMQEMGRPVDRLQVLRAVVGRFAARYAIIATDERLREDWSARLATLGRQVVARHQESVVAGLAEGVDESGALLIRADDGRLVRVDAADVTLRDTRP